MDVDLSQIELAEQHLNTLKGSRKGKLSALTRKINEIRRLMEEDDPENVMKCMKTFNEIEADFKQLHNSIQKLLSEEEAKEDQIEWFEPREAHINEFQSDVNSWLCRRTIHPLMISSDIEATQQRMIRPEDSVSQAPSNTSHRTRSSTTSSVRRKAEAEHAAHSRQSMTWTWKRQN